MFKHNWTKAFVLAGFLALPTTASMAAVVEMVLTPCTPQLRPEECGVKVSVPSGTATFTTINGDVVNIAPGVVVNISGTGIVSRSTQSGTIVNFASASNALTTGSIGGGGGGGGGGGQTNPYYRVSPR